MTGEQGTLLPAPPDEATPNPELLRRARQIAARLAMPRPRRDVTARRGVGELAGVRYNGGSDDIDLDRTIEQLVEHPVPEEDDIIVRERVRTRRSVVLLADVSGSMRGGCVRTAAATVGALAAELARDDLAVVAFWSDAAVLSHLGQHVAPQQLLDTMLRIPATISPLPQHRDEVTAAMLAAVEQVHGEDGCELFALHRDDDRLVMIERWASPAALQTHSTASPARQKLKADLDGKLAAPPDVVVLEPVLGGDPVKGQL